MYLCYWLAGANWGVIGSTSCLAVVEETARFCRQCGTPFSNRTLVATELSTNLSRVPPKDADELTGNGIGTVIVGDGFLMVAVILAVTASPISSLLWLLLLIPAFFFFGKGFADVLQARQIRRRMKLAAAESLTPSSVVDALPKSIPDELELPSVTERTTRNLK